MISILVVILLWASLVVGMTYAWFTADASIDTNTFIVEIPGTESAWTDGDNSFGGRNQYYFEYDIGDASSEGDAIKEDIFIGADKDVIGKVYVWDDGDTLYIKYKIDVDDVMIERALLYAKLTEPGFSGVGNNYDDGDESFDWPGVTEHKFELDEVNDTDIGDLIKDDTIYIAGKLDVFDNRE